MSSPNTQRSKTGCWTCRERKIKCDENRPKCKRCLPQNRECRWGPRPRARRRRRGVGSSRVSRSPARNNVAIAIANAEADAETRGNQGEAVPLRPSTSPLSLPLSLTIPGEKPSELPYGIQDRDWPLSLTETDRRAIGHYASNIIPRMVLKTPRWSSYSYVLFMCLKHRLLAHLLLSFSIRDMADNHEVELITAALEHYQEALNLFIRHLATPDSHSWVTFPALWVFILYEQTYGDDPKVLQAHLRGVRDVIASHGRVIIASSMGEEHGSSKSQERYRVPPQMINRMTLWTIHYDAKASTFGLGGGIIDLLNEKYPDLIGQICEDSTTALRDAWGLVYPADEDLWDLQVEPLSKLAHENAMLRYKLAKIECGGATQDSRDILQFGHELHVLEKMFSRYTPLVLSRRIKRSTNLSNMCVIVAEFFAIVVRHDRLAYDIQSSSLSKLLQICATLYEYEGPNFLQHVAWPMFVAGFETEDPIHQSWIIERFAQLQKCGTNMRRAMILLQVIFREQRVSRQPVRYDEWIRDDRFERFSI